MVKLSYKIGKSKKHGVGLFSKKNFKRNQLVLVCSGPIITKCSKLTLPIDYNLFLDLSDKKNHSKFINHSCEPNCGIKNRTQIVAMKNIKKGEEITIDYSMVLYDYDYYNWKGNIKCACGSKNCTGERGGYKNLSLSQKKRYKGFISEFLLKKPTKKYLPNRKF